MGKRLGCIVAAVVALALPAVAAGSPGSINGFVKSSSGIPQMGAAVEIFTSSTSPAKTVFTDARGYYSAGDLIPGTYYVKATLVSFLPSLRENVNLRSGATLVVNLTLSTLFEAIEMLPRRGNSADDDDWKWTLRSAANRPILRVLDNGQMVVVTQGGSMKPLTAQVALIAGSDAEGFGSTSDMNTNFAVDRSLFSSGTLSLNGNLGYGDSNQGAFRASYTHQMSDGSKPELAVTVRQFANPGSMAYNGPLQAISLSASDTFSLAEVVELHVGSEFQAVEFMGRATAARPFGSLDLHLSPTTVLEYQYATSEPNTRRSKGYDSAPADLSETNPRMSMVNDEAVLERARHQEVSLSHRFGQTSFQLAAYQDSISHTALLGAGEVYGSEDILLPDVYSSTFTYNGGQLDTNGLRAVVERKLTPGLSAVLNYSYGGVLDMAGPGLDWSSISSTIHRERRHAVAGKLFGVMPRTNTRWIASYKWINRDSLNPVDLFNSSAGQVDPFLNIFVRQPLPRTPFLPGKVEALMDLRNLLAQGYVPVVSRDGGTLYLVQSARSVRGGLAFVF